MDQILRMCEDTNYRDMTLIVSTVGYFSSRSAKHRIKFGKGWMGKDVEISGEGSGHAGHAVHD